MINKKEVLYRNYMLNSCFKTSTIDFISFYDALPIHAQNRSFKHLWEVGR